MADYLTTDTELTSIANAIRTKGGTSASLTYPTEFVSAIEAIPTGGSGETYTVELQTDMKVLDWDTLTLVTTSPEFHEGDGVIVQYTGPFISYDMVRTDTQETIPKLTLRTGSTNVYAYVMPDSDIQLLPDSDKP